MVDYYLYNLCSESLRDGLNLEQSCLQRSSASIFTSEWAAEAAKSNALCEDDSAKVHVVPYGANILCQRTETDIDAIIRSRQTKECNLLFIGKDLKRKNAAFAVQVVAEINRLGLASTLTIIGSSEQADIDYLPYVQSLGFIDKHSPHGMRLINEAFARSHFLIMPSRADCTPMVLAEANSFGLPCLAARTGGIPSVIHEGQNGYLFDTNASPASVAALVVDIFADYQHYFTLAKQSFREYQSRLNWSVSAGKVTSIVYNVLNQS
jgi:glycosyltransferase involved in cell wall biosynthesis